MTINLTSPDIRELRPHITVFGTGGAGGNAVNNMITAGLQGVDFVVANTDAQALTNAKAERLIHMGVTVTEGLGAGSQPEVGRAAAEECIDEIRDHLTNVHMVFITAGMGGGTGTGAAPVIARAARELGILTVGVVTKPFQFEGSRRMRLAEAGIQDLQQCVDTLIVIPNQNLFRVANERTTFADAFSMADQVLYSGVACITDLMVKDGLVNLDFADVRSIMRDMGRAMMGTGEAEGDGRAIQAAEAAIANPLLDDTHMRGAQGLLISITGGQDMTLFEVDEAATRIREEVDEDANIIFGATYDDAMEGKVRVSVVATGVAGGEEMQSHPRASLPEPKPAPKPAAPKVEASAPAEPAPQPRIEREVISTNGMTIRQTEAPARPPAPAAKPVEVTATVDTQPFIAPVAEEPVSSPRIPSLDDFPPIAQRQLRGEEEKRRSGGIGRFLFGRDEDGDDGAAPSKAIGQPVVHPAPAPRPEARHEVRSEPRQEPRHEPVYEPAPQAVRSGGLDGHGRSQPTARPLNEDEHLEIPAFLRRQTS